MEFLFPLLDEEEVSVLGSLFCLLPVPMSGSLVLS